MTLGGAEASDSGCGNKEGKSDKRIVHEPHFHFAEFWVRFKLGGGEGMNWMKDRR